MGKFSSSITSHQKETENILKELESTNNEIMRLKELFNFSQNNLQSERIIFQIKAAEIKYGYFFNLARKQISAKNENVAKS